MNNITKLKNIKASDLMVKCLENEGVEYIFGIPGEENLDIMESLRKSTIKFITTRHEQAAGFMAATYGRLTGKTGVCLATLGPGATNFVTASAYAKLGAMPILMITGQKPIKNNQQGKFQIVDIIELMKPITKFTKQIIHADSIPSLIRESFRIAETEKPGPVHLELPEDIAAEIIANTKLFAVTNIPEIVASENSIIKAAEMITQAKHPLLLIGAGANRHYNFDILKKFVEKTGIPFANTQMGKGVIGGKLGLYIGTSALSFNDYIHNAFDKADLIINVGHDITEKPPFLMKDNNTKVIHINYSPAEVDNVYFPQLEIIGDISSIFTKLITYVEKNPHHDFSYFMKVRDAVMTSIDDKKDDESFPIKPQKLCVEMRKNLNEDSILTLDNGIYKVWLARNYRVFKPNSILLDNALATMGAGLPSAIAAALIYPEKQIVSICGDGGFMMNSQELETAVRLKLHLTIIVLKDNAYGMIKWKQKIDNFKSYAMDFGNPDFVAYANSYGAIGHKISSVKEFCDCLNKCLNNKAVHLIELPIDYSENDKVLSEEIIKQGKKI